VIEEKSIILPGHFGDSKENIKIIDNFIELEDLKIIQMNGWMPDKINMQKMEHAPMTHHTGKIGSAAGTFYKEST
jgi:hypothetical protein